MRPKSICNGGSGMKLSLKYLVLLVVLVTGNSAFADDKDLPHQCEGKVAQFEAICTNMASLKETQTAVNGATTTNAQSIQDNAKEFLPVIRADQSMALQGANACSSAFKKLVVKDCDTYKKQAKAKATDEQSKAKAAEDIKRITSIQEAAYVKYQTYISSFATGFKEGEEAAFQTARVAAATEDGGGMFDDFTWKDAGKWGAIAGAAGAIGFGAIKALGGSSGNSSGNYSQTSGTGSVTGSTGTGTTTPTTPNCSDLATAVNNSACDTTTVTTCTPRAQITTANCQTFSARYCGMGGSNTGPGVGSSYCRSALANSFCATSGRSQCASCVEVAMQASPACASNPANCTGQFSAAQLQALQATAACASDPIYLDSSVFQAANPLLPAPVLPSSVDTSALGTSSRSVASSQSVSPAYGSSLLKINSDTLLDMCKKTELVSCNAL